MSESPQPEEKTKSKPERSPAPTPRRSRLRKWARRLFIGVIVLVLLAVTILFGGRAYFRYIGLRDLNAEMARLDTEDPGWRWDDLQAAYEKSAPSEAENSAVIVREARAMIPLEWKEWVERPKAVIAEEIRELEPLNRIQALEELTRDKDLSEATWKARNHALKLKDYPRGYHKIVVTDSPFVESLEETQGTREIARLMKIDAILATQDGKPIRGIQAAHAILNTARSIGDEPTLISSLVRFTLGIIAAESAMRVLALSDSKDILPELQLFQAALQAEANEPILFTGFRGERARMNRLFDGLSSGRIHTDNFLEMGGMKVTDQERIFFYFLRAFFPEDQRRYLHYMSQLIVAAKGLPHERIVNAKRIEAEIRSNRSVRYTFHQLLIRAGDYPNETSLRHRAELLSAAALIACERFRLTHGRWPDSLAELPKDLLPVIPTDPFTGEPMKSAKLPDGIAVYSLPPKELRNLDKPRLTNPLGGMELGWRLYDPKQRGLPPLPKPKEEMPEDEPMP